MIYASMILNLGLVGLVAALWLRNRDQRSDSERAAREFELMLQALQAEQRTELLQAHAMLMQRGMVAGADEERPEAAAAGNAS